ncbi:MAG: DUF4270 domain-containing protein [Bacteroides sp.]|nr:DUF4270 domain-containing protein [Ruminococcus flavefaciens]MCM1555151.1 DUF4270 domain-containing protein [Bacteroides sp.]
MFRGIFALVALLLMFSSCKTDPDAILGKNFHPEDDLVSKYDTAFRIEAFSISDDSLIIQNSSSVLLGTSFSPVFGSETYNLVVQVLTLRIDGDDSYNYYSGTDLDRNSRVDSVVLNLPYSGNFPDHGRMDGRKLNLSIHKITEGLVDGQGYDSAYCSNREPVYDPTPIGSMITVYPKPLDTVYDSVSGMTSVADLSMHLDKSFGKDLLNWILDMDEDQCSDLASLHQLGYLKGLYLKVEPCATEKESIVFSVSNLFALGADITVYFNGSGSEVGSTSTSYQKFVLGPLRYTHVKRDRSLSSDNLYKEQMEAAGDTAGGSQRLYVEASGGSRIRFRIPEFQDVVSGNVVINQAVVVLDNVDAGTTPDIGFPEQLQCIRYFNRGLEADILDASNPGGTYNSNSGQYRINVTRYLQRLAYLTTVDTANRKLFDNYLDIVPPSDERYEQPTRAVFYGPGVPEKGMRLEVIYTVVNDTLKN